MEKNTAAKTNKRAKYFQNNFSHKIITIHNKNQTIILE